MKKTWMDVSVPVRTGMVHWPTDPSVIIERFADMEKGAVCNVSQVAMCAHVGTHMDGLNHFVRDGAAIDTLPFDAVLGPCRVIEIKDKESVKGRELKRHNLRRGERILLKTRNSHRPWWELPFDPDFVHICQEGAQFLVDRGIRTIGIDYLSVGGFERDGVECHQVLLGAGVWIIEGLNLARVKPGRFEMICLPIRFHGGDGAPARALLRPR